jgi:hypothetical protein
MKTSKLFIFAAAFALVAVLSVSAMAQRTMRQEGSAFRLPPEPINPVVKVSAIEVTDGTVGMDARSKTETMFGYSFLGRTTGSLPGSFTLSMNCAPAIAVPEGTTELTGGSWTLPVYMLGLKSTGYAGSLYGTISKGEMNWDKTGTNAYVYIVLNVDGGTQNYDGVSGYATFAGTLFVDEKTQKTTLTGDMVFNTISKF